MSCQTAHRTMACPRVSCISQALLCGLLFIVSSSAFVPKFAALHHHSSFPRRQHQDTANRIFPAPGSHLLGVTDNKDTSSIVTNDNAIGNIIPKHNDSLDEEKFLEELELESAQLDEQNQLVEPEKIQPSEKQSGYWKYRGYDIFRQVALPNTSRTNAPAVILVHGFGCSTVYWRETIKALIDQGYEVHAIDLLGQGKSAKPTDGVEYSINLWAEQVGAYARENLPGRDLVLIGNSVGSLVSLTAATGVNDAGGPSYIRKHIAGLGFFNCGIGMNIRNILKDPKWNPVQRYLLNALFDVLETLVFGNAVLLRFIMEKLVTREMLRNVLRGLYSCAPDPDAKIDDELVDSFYLPAKETSSPLVLRQILTNEAGLTPIELHEKHKAFLDELPIHVVWGDVDDVVPLKWQVGSFYQELSMRKDNAVTMEVVHGGHILFDEVPEDSNGSMISWLLCINSIVKESL